MKGKFIETANAELQGDYKHNGFPSPWRGSLLKQASQALIQKAEEIGFPSPWRGSLLKLNIPIDYAEISIPVSVPVKGKFIETRKKSGVCETRQYRVSVPVKGKFIETWFLESDGIFIPECFRPREGEFIETTISESVKGLKSCFRPREGEVYWNKQFLKFKTE